MYSPALSEGDLTTLGPGSEGLEAKYIAEPALRQPHLHSLVRYSRYYSSQDLLEDLYEKPTETGKK
jgi:hypothetical protein